MPLRVEQGKPIILQAAAFLASFYKQQLF